MKHHPEQFIKSDFNYTTNATTTTTTQKQSDYKIEQSSFTPIILFQLEIGHCRGRNWINQNQALLLIRLVPIPVVCEVYLELR